MGAARDSRRQHPALVSGRGRRLRPRSRAARLGALRRAEPRRRRRAGVAAGVLRRGLLPQPHHVFHRRGGAGVDRAHRSIAGAGGLPVPGPRRDAARALVGVSALPFSQRLLLSSQAGDAGEGAAAIAAGGSSRRAGRRSWVDRDRGAIGHAHSPSLRRGAQRRRFGPRPSLGAALELLKAERFAEALAQLPAGNDPEALLLKAVLLTQAGQLEPAERTCAELLAIDELSAGAHYLLALCREGACDAEGAAEHDQLASHLDPAFVMPRVHLGLMARRAQDWQTARRELQQALHLLPREDSSRLLLFGGGFSREALISLCHAELAGLDQRGEK